MATIDHSNLGSGEIHEPKGVFSASSNQVYVANGTGSGSWTYFPTGWGYYADASGAAQTFDSTPSVLQIDGAGPTTEESYLPPEIRGSGSLWDTTNNLITPISVGDSYDVRIDLPITATATSPAYLFWTLDIGGGSSITIGIASGTLVIAKTAPFTLSIGVPVFCLSTFKTNGGQIFLSTDSGSVDVDEATIYISRNHAGGI